jgi:hypothetical protein
MVWMWKTRASSLMIVIAFLCAWLVLPFEWLTPQGQLYRQRADAYAVNAARYRAGERHARAMGDLEEANRCRVEARRIERQGWIYRKASWSEWKWPELKPGGLTRPGR